MRVCDINNLYSPTGGGVRTYHERKIQYYAQRADTPYALMVPSLHPEYERQGQVERVGLPAVALGQSGYALTLSPRAVEKALHRFQPDVIEVGSAYVMPALVHRAVTRGVLRKERRAVVGFIHANYPDTYVEPLFGKKSERLGAWGLSLADQHMRATYSRFDATFVASEHLQQKLEGLGVPHVYRTPLGFDPMDFHIDRRSEDVRREWGVKPNEKLIVFVGRLAADKGIDEFIAAYPELRRLPQTKTVVVGHGPRLLEVQELAASYGHLSMAGFIRERERLAALLASADLVLSLGRFETFSLATLEALASGTPVVAPDQGGAGELVRRSDCGYTFGVGDSASLVDACRKALSITAPQRARVAQWAKENFAWDVSFQRLHTQYEHTLERVRREAKHG